jgi:hypothetical protein
MPTVSGTTTIPAPRARTIMIYRFVLGASIVLNLAVGVFILFWPDAFTNALGQMEASPKTWPRHWGAQLLAINILYVPGFQDPLVHRWPNWSGIVIRLTFALFFFSQGDGFVPMGVYDGVSGLALLATYLPVVRGGATVKGGAPAPDTAVAAATRAP